MSVAEALRKGADKIEAGYWYRGKAAEHPEVLVLADGTVIPPPPDGYEGVGGCLVTAVDALRACDAIMRHLGVVGLAGIYRANDSQPLETGRQWAIDTLRAAADRAEKEELA